MLTLENTEIDITAVPRPICHKLAKSIVRVWQIWSQICNNYNEIDRVWYSNLTPEKFVLLIFRGAFFGFGQRWAKLAKTITMKSIEFGIQCWPPRSSIY